MNETGHSEGLTRQPKGPHEVRDARDQNRWLMRYLHPSMKRHDGNQIIVSVLLQRIQMLHKFVGVLISAFDLVFNGEAPH